jgi:hypothetical protein
MNVDVFLAACDRTAGRALPFVCAAAIAVIGVRGWQIAEGHVALRPDRAPVTELSLQGSELGTDVAAGPLPPAGRAPAKQPQFLPAAAASPPLPRADRGGPESAFIPGGAP